MSIGKDLIEASNSIAKSTKIPNDQKIEATKLVALSSIAQSLESIAESLDRIAHKDDWKGRMGPG